MQVAKEFVTLAGLRQQQTGVHDGRTVYNYFADFRSGLSLPVVAMRITYDMFIRLSELSKCATIVVEAVDGEEVRDSKRLSFEMIVKVKE